MSLKKDRTGKQTELELREQELMQRSWRDPTYWLAPHGKPILLSSRRKDHQPNDPMTPLIMVWALSQQSLTVGLPTIESYGDSFSTGAPSASLCQADLKLASTPHHVLSNF